MQKSKVYWNRDYSTCDCVDVHNTLMSLYPFVQYEFKIILAIQTFCVYWKLMTIVKLAEFSWDFLDKDIITQSCQVQTFNELILFQSVETRDTINYFIVPISSTLNIPLLGDNQNFSSHTFFSITHFLDFTLLRKNKKPVNRFETCKNGNTWKIAPAREWCIFGFGPKMNDRSAAKSIVLERYFVKRRYFSSQIGKPVIIGFDIIANENDSEAKLDSSLVANAVLEGVDGIFLATGALNVEETVNLVQSVHLVCREAENARWQRQIFQELSYKVFSTRNCPRREN